MNADQIIVLDKGRVAAIGRHAELLEDNEIYADIYTSQLLDDKQYVEPVRSESYQ
jgi:ATP-binding cassette subfamily B protein